MEYREIINSCYCGDGPEKLEKALIFSREYGKELLRNPEIISQLERVQAAVVSLNTHMAEMEMGKSCARCAATPKGGCCSAYMGHENPDVLQLLMNLLAGVEVELVLNHGGDCCFLGEKGCVLLFKPIFCLNYLCERIQKESSAGELTILEQKTGDLLGAQVALEQLLIRFL
jgi:hypothetical protein